MGGRHGYFGRILWIDLSSKTYTLEERDEIFWRLYAGGGLAAVKLLLEKTSPGIDPLGEENILIFASSVVAIHIGAGLLRFTTVSKSPLTFSIGETRTEGTWAWALKGCGADILAITGRSKKPSIIVIENRQVNFQDAEYLWGSEVGGTVDELEEMLGHSIHVAAIGPAGEKLVRFASIVTDCTYQASRMGMGLSWARSS